MAALVVIACFVLSILCSTVLVRMGIPALEASQSTAKSQRNMGETGSRDILPESGQKKKLLDWTSNGLWIGICETILVFVFTFE